MTVINAMKFNENDAGMVADSLSTNNVRKYEFADKIITLNPKEDVYFLVAGSGPADILYQAAERLQSAIPKQEEHSVENTAHMLAVIINGIKREMIGNFLQSTYGVSSTEAIQGHAFVNGNPVSIDPQLKEKIMGAYIMEDRRLYDLFKGAFLLLGKAQKGTALYNIELHGPTLLSARPYASIGTGSDQSDLVLYNFLKNIRREARNNIDFVKGMAALLRATNASTDVNPGVGGVPAISYFKDNIMITLKEDESRLASELVRVNDAGLLSEDKFRLNLEALLSGKANYEKIEKKAFSENHQNSKIMRILRGYKE